MSLRKTLGTTRFDSPRSTCSEFMAICGLFSLQAEPLGAGVPSCSAFTPRDLGVALLVEYCDELPQIWTLILRPSEDHEALLRSLFRRLEFLGFDRWEGGYNFLAVAMTDPPIIRFLLDSIVSGGWDASAFSAEAKRFEEYVRSLPRCTLDLGPAKEIWTSAEMAVAMKRVEEMEASPEGRAELRRIVQVVEGGAS